MPIAKKNTLEYKLSSIPKGKLVFLSDLLDYDVAFCCRTLSKKCKEGEFMKLTTGVYVKPKITRFGPSYPSIEEVVKAIAKKDNIQVIQSGMYALNALGFSTQVPMRLVYLTSGSSRKIKINGMTVKLMRSVPKNFAFKSGFYALLYQALKAIGKNNITEEELSQLSILINKFPEPKAFEHDINLMSQWMRKLIKSVKKNDI